MDVVVRGQQQPFDRMTGKDGLQAPGSSSQGGKAGGSVLKQHLDCFTVYPPAFWHISSVISLAL